jgi:predicted AlkP superfamily phosphohydrolase/phosphomutase
MSKQKLVVIGLDGVESNLINLLIKNNKIPHLQKFISENGLHPLKSTYPPTSFPAWPVMLTGKNQAEINCFETLSKKGYSYGTKSFSNLKNIWDDLSTAGKTVGVINIPGTFPAKKVNGFMLTGIYTPSLNDNFIYPEHLKEEIEEELKNYDFFLKYNTESDFIQDITSLIKVRFKIIDKLYFKHQPDFFLFEESTTDWIQHCFSKYIHECHPQYEESHYQQLVFDYFELLDSLIGDFLSRLDPQTKIMIVSDHGSQPQKGKFFLNKILEKKGFLKLKSTSSLPLKIMSALNLDDEKIIHFLSKLKIKKIISKVLAGTKLNRKMIRAGGGISWNLAVEKNLIDWNCTKAFSIFAGFIYINQKNKEKEGVVSEEEYDQVREEIINELKKITELELVVYKKEELYHGKYFENAPDLVVHEKSFQYWPTDSVKANNFFIPLDKHSYHNGTHSLHGIFTSNLPDILEENLDVSYVGKRIRAFFGIKINTETQSIIENIKL